MIGVGLPQVVDVAVSFRFVGVIFDDYVVFAIPELLAHDYRGVARSPSVGERMVNRGGSVRVHGACEGGGPVAMPPNWIFADWLWYRWCVSLHEESVVGHYVAPKAVV